MRLRHIAIVSFALAALLAAPASAHAAAASKGNGKAKTGKAAVSTPATTTYDLDFSLPTAGKSGCTVCHGDPNLVRPSGLTTQTLYVDTEVMAGSAHREVPCTGCHVDFAYKTPHENVAAGEEWRDVSRLACKNCKQHAPQFSEIINGAHSPSGKPGEDPKLAAAARVKAGKPERLPLCGDCHGSHDIASKDDKAGQRAFHAKGHEVCGGCHERESLSYADYYHGAAYRAGSPDAPACWDCHEQHAVLPTSDRNATVHPARLVTTCGKCHEDADVNYTAYAELVHRRAEVEAANPVWSLVDSARAVIQGVFRQIGSWF